MGIKTPTPERLKFWQERVEKSNGQSFFVPDALKEEYDELMKTRLDLEQDGIALSKKSAAFKNRINNFWFKMQNYLEENQGMKDVWVKDLGEDDSALKEGIGVINIMEPTAPLR